MAKLFDNIETGNKKKDNLIKGIIVLALFASIALVSIVYDRTKEEYYIEESTASCIMVHIKGAVENSGVYEVPFGTRVMDIGELAGGFAPDADIDGINLAEYVEDGEEIYIPYKGSVEKGGYDLNKITYEELVKNIDGIGTTYAGRIIEYREKQGGFKNVAELRSVLNENAYKKVRELFYVEE